VEPVPAALLQEHPRHRVLLAGHGELLGWWHRLGSASWNNSGDIGEQLSPLRLDGEV